MRFFSLSALFSLPLVAQATPQVQLGETTVLGSLSETSSNVEIFKALPFAEPPVGALRFKPSILRPSLNGSTFNATAFGPACLQLPSPFDPTSANQTTSEDCLQLNVFRPAGVNQSLPVMFWIHGGGFTGGTAIAYDGTTLVNRSISNGTPIMFVSTNYRLAEVGFPNGQELAKENALNLGLKDQLVALEWVQKNIGAFGGDKSKVTIAGESAGGVSVAIQTLGHSLKDLARGAIIQSGAELPLRTPSEGNDYWKAFVNGVPECAPISNSSSTFNCLSNVTSDTLQKAMTGSVQLALDGKDGVLPDYYSRLHLGSPMPTLIGSNLDEGTLFMIFSAQNTTSIEDTKSAITGIMGDLGSPRGPEVLNRTVNELVSLYPDDAAAGSPFGSGNETFGFNKEYKRASAVYGDVLFQSFRRSFAQKLDRAGAKVYAYQFAEHAFDFGPFIPGTPPGALGVCHGVDLAYFNYFPFIILTDPTAIEAANRLQDYWISFVHSLDPNHEQTNGSSKWPVYHSDRKRVLQIEAKKLTIIPDTYREKQIEVINKDPLVFGR